MFPDKVTNISWVENFCRNFPLDDAGGPYCYTTDPDVRWEECLVEMCQDSKYMLGWWVLFVIYPNSEYKLGEVVGVFS